MGLIIDPHRSTIGADTSGGISRRSMVIAAFSTVVEWYDFTLYLYFASVLSRLFFGTTPAALASTLGAFAAAYLLRPIGAAVFGHIGDRFGRRRMMLLSMGLMTIAMLTTACLPTAAAIGPLAGRLLLLLRCVMAFSVGGEYTGVVAYLLECAPVERRGFITSWASAASELGGLLAVGVSAATVAATDAAMLSAWGWRIPFFVGALLAGSILLARSTMEESPDFERQQAAGTAPMNPLGHVLRTQRLAIARGFAISALGSITYYIGITYVPTLLVGTHAMGEGAALTLSTIAAVVVILVTPLVGILTDRVGRRPVLLAAAACAAALPIPMFALMAGDASRALIGAVVLAAIGGAVSAVGAVATAEQFAGEGRLSGLALGATGATALFGGLAPYIAQLLVGRSGSALAPGAMICLVALAVLPVLFAMPETKPNRPAPWLSAD
jgi:MFS transporter, MHS family, proline/betaine transporter